MEYDIKTRTVEIEKEAQQKIDERVSQIREDYASRTFVSDEVVKVV